MNCIWGEFREKGKEEREKRKEERFWEMEVGKRVWFFETLGYHNPTDAIPMPYRCYTVAYYLGIRATRFEKAFISG